MNAPIALVLSNRDIELFWSRVIIGPTPESCWGWTGATNDGYARVRAMGNTRPAHRVSFLIANGRIPDGLVIDHLCRNRICTNPNHLEAVSNTENLLRSPITIPGSAVRRSNCLYGHPLDGTKGKGGERYCRTCKRARDRIYRAAKQAA